MYTSVFFVVSGFFSPLCSPQFDAYQTASDAIAFKLILNKAWVFFCNWCIGKLVNWEVK